MSNNNIFSKFELFLFDGDGVLYKEDEPIPGAIELINELQQREKEIFIVTNNSTKTREEFRLKLANMGIKVDISHILTSAYLTSLEISNESYGATVYVIGEDGLKQELMNAGLKVINVDPEPNTVDVWDIALEDVDYVVTGMDRTLTYVKLARAMTILMNKSKNVKFIATNGDITFPTPQGLIPGGGAMIHILETLSGRQVERVIGKPHPLMFNVAIERAGVRKDKVLMIGDRLGTDIVGAKKAGIAACFVLTGISTLSDLEQIPSEYQPDILVNDLNDILNALT
ncbi:MAG: HAD-IIA family hydrolase [Candidatus Heimdallarchaeaceae archaeon]